MIPFIPPIAAFLIVLAATPLVRALARKRGWIARPTADRWHKKPTALMGGIGIFLGLGLPLLWLSSASFADLLLPGSAAVRLVESPESSGFAGAVLFLGALFMFTLGFVDDRLRLKPQTKLLGQIMTASLVAYFGFRLHWLNSLTADTLVTILWIVGITNAMNLLDNMDGLAAGVGAISGLFLFMVLSASHPHVAIYALTLSAALAAFLVYNFNPASIFMGDCGSLVIGFSLAFLSVCYAGYSEPRTGLMARFAVPVMCLLVPIFDTTLVTLIRTLSGRKASVGGRDHTSHRLVLIGLSEKRAVLFLYAVAAAAGLSANFVHAEDSLTSPAVMVPVAAAFLLMGLYLAQLRVYPEKEFSVLRGKTFTPILMELTYKRQILLVLFDFALIAFAYYLSYRLRFSRPEFSRFFPVFLKSYPAVIACTLFAYFLMGVYRGIWSFLSFNDIYVYVKATTLGVLLSVAVLTYAYRFQNFSKGIFVIDWFLTTGFLLGTRASFRLFLDAMKKSSLVGEPVLIYGAGRGGEILLREILNNRRLHVRPAGFLDDDPLKTGKRLQGFPILGAWSDAEQLATQHKIAGIVISFRDESPERLQEIRGFCRANRLFLKRFTVGVEDLEPAP